MYELLANGSAAADSGAVTVVAGTPVTVAITYSPDFLPREASLGGYVISAISIVEVP